MFDNRTVPSAAKLALMATLTASMMTGCATTRMALRYGELESQSQMSQSVFLEPGGVPPRTVYVEERHATGEGIAVRPALEGHLSAAGYTLVDAPERATYVMQINHLSLTETELSDGQTINDAIESAWMAGGGAAVAAAVFGAEGAMGEIGLAVGVVGFLVDSRTKHVAHTLTTDVLVTEAVPVGEGEELRHHETRIVTAASKMNLGRGEALPAILADLSDSLAGILPRRGPN